MYTFLQSQEKKLGLFGLCIVGSLFGFFACGSNTPPGFYFDSDTDSDADVDTDTDTDADTDTDTDADTDTDTDADTDTDTDADGDCDPSATWGDGFSDGDPVPNWEMSGNFDGDGDGEIDVDMEDFNLEDIYCAGYNSTVILLINDSGAFVGASFFEEAVFVEMESRVNDANGALLMFHDNSGDSAEDTLDYFSTYFDGGYYVAGSPPFDFPWTPFIAVVDLTTGELVADGSYPLTAEEIIAIVESIDLAAQG